MQSVDKEGADGHELDENPFLSEVCVFKKGKRVGVVEIVSKGILVRYPDGGLVEDFPWEDYGLCRVIRGAVSHKR